MNYLALEVHDMCFTQAHSICSKVLIVRRSLGILDVRLLLDLDAVVGQLLVRDHVLAIVLLARTLPVPRESAHVLKTSHLLIGQVSDNLEHFTTVTVVAEDVRHDAATSEGIPPEGVGDDEATDDKLGVASIVEN